MVDRFYLKNVSLGCNLEYEKKRKMRKKVNNINKKKIGLVSARAQAIGKASLDPVNCYKKSS